MIFQAKVNLFDEPVNLVWRDGSFTGNGTAIRLLLLEAEGLEGEPVGPFGQQTTTRHLSSGVSAVSIILRVFPEAELSGEVPESEDVPDGAIV